MFTIDQIESAHQKVKSGADFPNYIRDIKLLGIIKFETWVYDSHTIYFGENDYSTISDPQYNILTIENHLNEELFIQKLKAHQKGKTDYFTFCQDCATTGIAKWVMDLNAFTCTYFDTANNEIYKETIPSK